MTQSDVCLYSGSHNIPIYQRNGFVEERNLSINLFDFGDSLQIKLRDLSEYSFNYTENIDLGDFEVIRVNQSLDINYSEFKTDIVEMLFQFQKKEMYLKCQLSDKICTLVFYTKSKIKCMVYLTLDLHMTDQKEIIAEMCAEIHEAQETNRRLHKQLSKTKKLVEDKELELHDLEMGKKNVVEQFSKNLNQIKVLFTSKLTDLQIQVLDRILPFKTRISDLHNKVEILKHENNLKVDSSERLLKTMENLRLETIENAATIKSLKKENSSLNILKANLEDNIAELKKSMEDLQGLNRGLEKKKVELENDLEKLSIIVTQKDSKISELSKDLMQANNMLVGFNKHYDDKAQQVEELQNSLDMKEKQLTEKGVQFGELLKAFNDYKMNFNCDGFKKIKQDLFMSNKKVGDLEEEIRKLNKINALLSQKVSEGYFRMT